ncbi:MAG: hypothetical protein JWP74_3353 [Marmoricola sp.]|nr:hypothetical protein [Marmoricola sp.]
MKVTGIDRHATAAVIRASGGFVTTPQFQYVLISFEATYTGTHASADVEDDLAWQLTTRHQTIPAAGTSPPAVYAHWPTATRPGGTVKFQVVFDVAPRSLRHAVLSVGRTGSSFGTVHGDFQL